MRPVFSIEEQLIKAYHLCLILSQGLPHFVPAVIALFEASGLT